ncbi:hypothetical protein BKA93DRAFT_242979 [Sparassis latifolia]
MLSSCFRTGSARCPPFRTRLDVNAVYCLPRRNFTPPRAAVQSKPRLQTFTRRTLYTVVSLGGLWFLDREYNASSVARNLRTFWTRSAKLLRSRSFEPFVMLCL